MWNKTQTCEDLYNVQGEIKHKTLVIVKLRVQARVSVWVRVRLGKQIIKTNKNIRIRSKIESRNKT